MASPYASFHNTRVEIKKLLTLIVSDPHVCETKPDLSSSKTVSLYFICCLLLMICRVNVQRFIWKVPPYNHSRVGYDTSELVLETDPLNRVNISTDLNVPENDNLTSPLLNYWGPQSEWAQLRHHYYLSSYFGQPQESLFTVMAWDVFFFFQSQS